MDKFEICGFENLHVHTDNSLLDGFAFVEEYAQRAPQINQRYLCITDHGMMAAVPSQIKECEANGIEPLFGNELYCNPLQRHFENDKEKTDFIFPLTEEKKNSLDLSSHLL